MKLTHSTATSGTQKSPLHRLRNIIGNATTAAALALGGQAAMADTVDTRPLMTSTVVQDGSAFSYGVTIGGRAVPAGNPVQLFPNRYNKADTVTSVDLSNFFSLTATNSTENTKLEGGKKTLITELIQEAAQNFPSTQNGAKIIHLHCSKTCADALKKMNLTFEGATQIVWDIASTVGSQNTLTIGPKDLSTEYKQDLARGISQVSVSPVARYTNDHP